MKKTLLLSVVILYQVALFAQFSEPKKELFYEVKSIGEKPIKKSTLKTLLV